MNFMKNFFYWQKIFQVLIKILQITNFQGVNNDNNNFIYTLFIAVANVYVCKIFLIYIKF